MATDYAGAVRAGSMAAARLHAALNTRAHFDLHGGAIDVFGAAVDLDLPLILRPLSGLLGAYLQMPTPGVLVTTQRPLSIQRFTAAHEIGHFQLNHLPSLDDESILRRMAAPNTPALFGPNLQEVEADAFAAAFLMPRWLVQAHCARQGWLARDLEAPDNLYQLSLRLGVSYEATAWTLQRLNIISPSISRDLRAARPRDLKAELLRDYKPDNYRGDVWLLTERDSNTRIDGSRNDHFILRLNEQSGAGYLWNIDQLRASGFAIVSDQRESHDHHSIGGPTSRRVTGRPDHPQKGRVRLDEIRPWIPDEPGHSLTIDYDFSGPEEEGLSRAERRHILEAA